MLKIESKEMCVGCYACYSSCPVNCIEMIEDDEGFSYPRVSSNKCIECHKCEYVCPVINKPKFSIQSVIGFGGYAKDAAVRELASSGGIFFLIASQIIKDGGVVFGAAFKDVAEVSHSCSKDLDSLKAMCKSKYVQSEIGDTFLEAKQYLDKGIMVMFTGTPCQIAGLKNFLSKDYANLLTADIVCHGVPSPLVLQKYLDYRSKLQNSTIKKIAFRNKSYGWSRHSVKIDFNDGNHYIKPSIDDLYMKAYLKNLSIRPSCYECHFKGVSRCSDLTFADFWGVQKVAPQILCKDGTSLLLVHSEKGKKMLEDVRDMVEIQEIEIEKAIDYNRSIVKSPSRPARRDDFFSSVIKNGFYSIEREFLKDDVITMWKRKVRTGINKLTRD